MMVLLDSVLNNYLLAWIMATSLLLLAFLITFWVLLRTRRRAPDDDDDEWPVVILLMDEDEQVETDDLDEDSGSLSFEDPVEGTEDPKDIVVPQAEDEEEKEPSAALAPLENPPLAPEPLQTSPKQKKIRLVRNNNIPPPCLLPTQHEEPKRQKRITFIGHSYVKELEKKNFELVLSSKRITPEYIGVPGGTFKTYLNNHHYFQTLRNTQPEIVVVILGGNDIKSEEGLRKNFQECTQFYRILRDTVPSAFIIASQVETRFYKPNNRHGCPTHQRFDRIRRQFNRFLERLTFHDLVLEIEDQLVEKKDYRDGVHLSHAGFEKYLDILQRTMNLAEERTRTHGNTGARKDPANHHETTSDGPAEGPTVPVKKDPAQDCNKETPPARKRRPVAADFF